MENRTFKEFIGEVFGTFILILLGDGVVANVGLAPRLAGTAYNWNTITIGWAFAVIIAVYVSAGVSGAHLNPAVTLGLAVRRGFPWKKVFPYIVAQMIGAFLGAAAVYLVYRDGLVAAGMPNVWSTGPGSVYSGVFFGADKAGAAGGAGQNGRGEAHPLLQLQPRLVKLVANHLPFVQRQVELAQQLLDEVAVARFGGDAPGRSVQLTDVAQLP